MWFNCVTLHCGIVFFNRFVWLQQSGVAVDSRHSSGNNSCRSDGPDRLEMYHILEGTVMTVVTCAVYRKLIHNQEKMVNSSVLSLLASPLTE